MKLTSNDLNLVYFDIDRSISHKKDEASDGRCFKLSHNFGEITLSVNELRVIHEQLNLWFGK